MTVRRCWHPPVRRRAAHGRGVAGGSSQTSPAVLQLSMSLTSAKLSITLDSCMPDRAVSVNGPSCPWRRPSAQRWRSPMCVSQSASHRVTQSASSPGGQGELRGARRACPGGSRCRRRRAGPARPAFPPRSARRGRRRRPGPGRRGVRRPARRPGHRGGPAGRRGARRRLSSRGSRPRRRCSRRRARPEPFETRAQWSPRADGSGQSPAVWTRREPERPTTSAVATQRRDGSG